MFFYLFLCSANIFHFLWFLIDKVATVSTLKVIKGHNSVKRKMKIGFVLYVHRLIMLYIYTAKIS